MSRSYVVGLSKILASIWLCLSWLLRPLGIWFFLAYFQPAASGSKLVSNLSSICA